MAHDLVTELLQYSSLACFMPIWQLCANLLIPNCLRSNLSYSPLAALELYVTKSTITAIILLILRSFQRKGLCNSGLKAKSTTFVRNITTIRLRSQFVTLKIKIEIWQII